MFITKKKYQKEINELKEFLKYRTRSYTYFEFLGVPCRHRQEVEMQEAIDAICDHLGIDIIKNETPTKVEARKVKKQEGEKP